MANLTEAWTRAAAMMPHGFILAGVGTRDVFPDYASAAEELEWIAVARDTEGHSRMGYGSTAIQALLDLANRAERDRGQVNG